MNSPLCLLVLERIMACAVRVPRLALALVLAETERQRKVTT